MAKNLISGFRCTEQCPLNKAEPLARLPGAADLARNEIGRKLDHALVDMLKKNRGQDDNLEKQKRGPKIFPGLDLATAAADEVEVTGRSGLSASRKRPQASVSSRGHGRGKPRATPVDSPSDESFTSSETELDEDADDDNDEEDLCFSCQYLYATYAGSD